MIDLFIPIVIATGKICDKLLIIGLVTHTRDNLIGTMNLINDRRNQAEFKLEPRGAAVDGKGRSQVFVRGGGGKFFLAMNKLHSYIVTMIS